MRKGGKLSGDHLAQDEVNNGNYRQELHEVYTRVGSLETGQAGLTALIQTHNGRFDSIDANIAVLLNKRPEKTDVRAWIALFVAAVSVIITIAGGFAYLGYSSLQEKSAVQMRFLKEEDAQQKSEMAALHGVFAGHNESNHTADLITAEIRGEYKAIMDGLQTQIDNMIKQADHMDELHHIQDEKISTVERAAERHDANFKAIAAWDISLRQLGTR